MPSPATVVQVASLQPLGESSLAIVATLLTRTAEVTPVESNVVEATVAIAPGTARALPNQPAPQEDEESSREEVTGSEEQGGEPNQALQAQATLSPLNRFLYRLEDAIEKSRLDVRESNFASTHPVGRLERSIRALDEVLDRWSPALAAAGGPSPAILGTDSGSRDHRDSASVIATAVTVALAGIVRGVGDPMARSLATLSTSTTSWLPFRPSKG